MGKVSEYLVSLGETADEVANSLRKQGIKGIRKDPCRCALALGIRNRFPGAVGLKVDYNRMTYNDPQTTDPKHTKATKQFAINFDGHMYPDLEE